MRWPISYPTVHKCTCSICVTHRLHTNPTSYGSYSTACTQDMPHPPGAIGCCCTSALHAARHTRYSPTPHVPCPMCMQVASLHHTCTNQTQVVPDTSDSIPTLHGPLDAASLPDMQRQTLGLPGVCKLHYHAPKGIGTTLGKDSTAIPPPHSGTFWDTPKQPWGSEPPHPSPHHHGLWN